jgi:hypothetical protein
MTEPPTGPLIGSLAGDRCATCGAPLASDQRYCVQCGERRGKARFPAAAPTAAAEPAPAPAASHEPARRRVPSGATLVAGIATLLLAMGVGVEIGRSGKDSASAQRASQPAVQVVTVAGGGAGAATTPTTAAATNTKTKTPKKGAKTTAAANKPISKKVVVKAAAAASQVLGGSAPAQPTVQQGQKCAGGTSNGCNSSGKFDGSFFGQ